MQERHFIRKCCYAYKGSAKMIFHSHVIMSLVLFSYCLWLCWPFLQYLSIVYYLDMSMVLQYCLCVLAGTASCIKWLPPPTFLLSFFSKWQWVLPLKRSQHSCGISRHAQSWSLFHMHFYILAGIGGLCKVFKKSVSLILNNILQSINPPWNCIFLFNVSISLVLSHSICPPPNMLYLL